ncbi:hypothetical protein JTE90_027392 [Oedothorax gibbosus]|uniref:ECT2 PH domain-containing protein n=1 Tax=Oedothorax gibbosus TaxID=931172 RepID=A0AAV6VZ62_9ARAC|nr:hypothetical protein JTE90_027392 [Oedothorax gibbosus]
MTKLKEFKGITDEQIDLFDTFNAIQNFPKCLVSSYRGLISKTDMTKFDYSKKCGLVVTMFLFHDTLVICKRKVNKTLCCIFCNNKHKLYKYLYHIPLSCVLRVVDVVAASDDCKNIFFFVERYAMYIEQVHVFKLIESVTKSLFISTLSRQIALIQSEDLKYILICISSERCKDLMSY